MIKKKSLIIFGGTGFIGYHLAKKSLKNNWKVTCVSTNYPKNFRKLSKAKYVRCDISKKSKLKNLIKKKYTFVVNLAGYVDHSKKHKTFSYKSRFDKDLENTTDVSSKWNELKSANTRKPSLFGSLYLRIIVLLCLLVFIYFLNSKL